MVQALSVPFPLLVISEILGVPEEEWRRCYEWSEAVIPGATDWPQERRNELMGDMVGYLLDATKQRRASPRNDVLSELATVTHRRRQTDRRRAGDVPGATPGRRQRDHPEHAVGRARGVGRRPRSSGDACARTARLVKSAVEELLRFTTPVISFMRTATRDAVLGGQPIAEGEPLLLLFASADRDEAVFGPDGRACWTSVGTRTRTWRSGSATTSASVRRWPVSKAGSSWRSFSRASRRSSERARSIRSPSSVIAGVRRAELCFS